MLVLLKNHLLNYFNAFLGVKKTSTTYNDGKFYVLKKKT